MTESRDARLGRLSMRSRRRGILEMDLILGAFADAALKGLSDADLDLYDLLLAESDHDLLLWVTRARPAPEAYHALVARIAAVAAKGTGR